MNSSLLLIKSNNWNTPRGLFQLLSIFCFLTLISFFAWNYFGLLFIIFLILIFFHIHHCEKLRLKTFFIRTILLILAWQFGALFWMLNIDKGILGLIANIIMYVSIFVIFFYIKKHIKPSTFSFIPFWLSFELFLNMYHFSFPWLTLGNLFSSQIYLIQWYDISGVLGGSLWILSIAYFLFTGLLNRSKKGYIIFILVLIIPPLYSFTQLNRYNNKSHNKTEKIVTYNNQYDLPHRSNDGLAINILKKVDPSSSYKSIIIPEQTFRGFLHKDYQKTLAYQFFQDYLNKGVFENIVLGATGRIKKGILVNSALIMTKDTSYYKNKKILVPYTEYIFPILHPFFKKKFYRADTEDSETQIINQLRIAPIICYESIYPFYVANKSKNVTYIYVLSSEKFMNDNQYGKTQYDRIIALRAIENGRPIIKASNNGNSMAIQTNGNIIQKSSKELNYISVPKTNSGNTFWNKYAYKITIIIIVLLSILCFFPKLEKILKTKNIANMIYRK
ncbi:nitrilase-related carbon-nitrogen hydrolase [Sinomicrobium weinanense]|uniref:Apolipoprotein N-acyltransferase n=1 Tax=Sinomicrobium weinanense TaxID=2842200 RepID=A0A926JSV3_9FLAO|nr:nitrilase-related carbon-nitrogen hydrolase [Sinomicrobium weinanense]MBC9796756.1 hypothetical protein [Sinomicrobium weinanense]MBU3124027.1 hypothetical protein [Sinomicrobium weinanense]